VTLLEGMIRAELDCHFPKLRSRFADVTQFCVDHETVTMMGTDLRPRHIKNMIEEFEKKMPRGLNPPKGVPSTMKDLRVRMVQAGCKVNEDRTCENSFFISVISEERVWDKPCLEYLYVHHDRTLVTTTRNEELL